MKQSKIRKDILKNDLPEPQYGGTMNLRSNSEILTFDPNDKAFRSTIMSGWLETLHASYWPTAPDSFDHKYDHLNYTNCHLAESWEFTKPGTYVVHLRKGIHWQDIPPVNGREFTSDDVAYHYHRMYGLGHGFTKPGPGAHYQFTPMESVTATDRYTVVFKWKVTVEEIVRESMQAWGSLNSLEPREVVEKWGNLDDWHHAIGTGPFILKDITPGNSATLVKNPNYWGHDEKNTHNKLPYIDTLKILIIPEKAKAIEALRSGQIDVLDGLTPAEADEIQQTNPELLRVTYPPGNAITLDLRNDKVPFNDIRVRKAMQMAIDLPTICHTYYHDTCLPYPSTVISNYQEGWGFPYPQWPQELKDEYAYNPTRAKQLLTEAGYPDGFKTNIVADMAGDMELLKIVKNYLAAVGIDMEIRPMEHSIMVPFVYGRKHDQMSQFGLTGKLGTFGGNHINFLSRLASGPSNYMVIEDPVYDTFHPRAWAATSFDEVKQLVRDCNEHVARHHFIVSLLQPMECALYQPWFKGYSGQRDSISGTAGPQLLFYYPARFWIDQNLKKSMGH